MSQNQCDGCNCQIPIEGGIHRAPYPSGSMGCAKRFYTEEFDKKFLINQVTNKPKDVRRKEKEPYRFQRTTG